MHKLEDDYIILNDDNLLNNDTEYEIRQKEIMGDLYQTMLDNIKTNFDDIPSLEELVHHCDSTQRINNKEYKRNNSNFVLNVDNELNSRRNSSYYLHHKYIMGVNKLPNNELTQDQYIQDVVERATNDQCHDVIAFCEKINNDLERIYKEDNKVYGESIYYDISFLDMFERSQMPKGNFISKKVRNKPFYKKLRHEIYMKNKIDPIFVKNAKYYPFAKNCGYRI